MDSYAGIVEQWVRRITDEYGARLAARGVDNEARRKSNAFCALCVASLLDLDEAKAVDCLTDGGEDGGIDAIHVGETLHRAQRRRKTGGRQSETASQRTAQRARVEGLPLDGAGRQAFLGQYLELGMEVGILVQQARHASHFALCPASGCEHRAESSSVPRETWPVATLPDPGPEVFAIHNGLTG